MKLLLLVLSVLRFNFLIASFCGESSVPFSFEAQPNGQPILGCVRPTCFGWTADGEPISRNSQFYRVLKVPDGFHKKSTVKPRKMNRFDRQFYREQIAVCEAAYESESCSGTEQWVGGIGPMYNAAILPLALQCCTYKFLRESSTDRGVAIVNPGQIVVGGEVLKNDRQYAFDYIADVLKMRNEDGSVSYDVTVRRFPCLPIPDEPSTPVDEAVLEEIKAKFGQQETAVTNKKLEPVLFQAPIRETEPIVLQPSERVRPVLPAQQPPFAQTSNAAVQTAALASTGIRDEAGSAAPVYPAYGGSSSYCFSGDTLVRLYDGRDVYLREVNVSDWVLSKYMNEITYAQIISWIHRLPNEEVEFYRIILKDGSQLKLTAKHFIYRTVCDKLPGQKVNIDLIENEAEWAQNIIVGDCLYKVENMEDNLYFVKVEVIYVERLVEKGIYAPMTSTGDIIVNGIHASCHNIIHSHSMQFSFFESADRIAEWFQWLIGAKKTTDQKDLPLGLDLITDLLALILPFDLHTF